MGNEWVWVGLIGLGLWAMAKRNPRQNPERPSLVEEYALMLERRGAVIDDLSGVVVYQDDPRGPTFGSFRDSWRYDAARNG